MIDRCLSDHSLTRREHPFEVYLDLLKHPSFKTIPVAVFFIDGLPVKVRIDIGKVFVAAVTPGHSWIISGSYALPLVQSHLNIDDWLYI